MKIHVDFSIFSSPQKAYGNVTGYIEVPEILSPGDSVSFAISKSGRPLPHCGFDGTLIVESWSIDAESGVITVALSEVYVDGEAAAQQLMDYFEHECGLVAYPYVAD